MQNKTVAILESRLGEQFAELIRRQGATALHAPALAELPDLDPAHIAALLDDWQAAPPDIFIFQTGVGTRALFAATDALGRTPEFIDLLDGATIVVRGPKPTGVLRSRSVRIDLAATDPFTTEEVLAELDTDLRGRRVVVQRYGERNAALQASLVERGAEVTEIATYRWGLPADVAPMESLIDALARDAVDLVAFTSASQVHNLFAVAQGRGRDGVLREGLLRTRVASIGPVCSAALREAGLRVDVEASPPKLGPLMAAMADALRT